MEADPAGTVRGMKWAAGMTSAGSTWRSSTRMAVSLARISGPVSLGRVLLGV